MNEQEAFEQAIREDPIDAVSRYSYADWLDEHDQPEKADFYRSWTMAKHLESESWLMEFLKILQFEPYEGLAEPDYNELLESARRHLVTGERTQYLNFDIPGELYLESKRKEFWEHYQMVTGQYIPEKGYAGFFFRCAC